MGTAANRFHMHTEHDHPAHGPLADVRIIDLCDEKGTFCTKLLADLGAHVVRVQLPRKDRADDGWAAGETSQCVKAESLHVAHNTKTRHLALNYRQPTGRHRLIELASEVDVVVESFPPGYLDAIGLGFTMLRQRNPALTMASITGFGQTGPRKDDPSCDLVASATAGQAYISGQAHMPPTAPFGMQAYHSGSLFAAIGILLALQGRYRDGKGRHIDISLQESVAATLDHVWVRYFQESIITDRQGDRHWDDLFCILPCKDGFIHLTPLLQWDTLVDWLDGEGMAEDLKAAAYQDESYRKAQVEHVLAVLARWTRTHPAAELFQVGQLMGFPWAPVVDPAAVLASEQLRARNFFKPSTDETVPACPGLPYTFRPPFALSAKTAVAHMDDTNVIRENNPRPEQIESANHAMPKNAVSMGHAVLSGVRILDFTRVLAGPYATRILGDFGAEVIKVQSVKTATGIDDNKGAFFATWNRNKLGISLDMSRPEAKQLALRLVAISDVVIDNFSPRVMANWGLDYDALRRARPDIIMASMSAMGQTGPWKDFKGYASTIHSLSGHTFLNANDKKKPTGLGSSYADVISGLYCALVVVAALAHRRQTGRGLYIDLSEYEAACTLLGPVMMAQAARGGSQSPPSVGDACMAAAPYGCYPCLGEDSWCAIAVVDDRQWQALGEVMGDPAWVRDRRFTSMERRIRHRHELDRRMRAWTLSTPADVLAGQLIAAGIPAGVVANAQDVAHDPHLSVRGFFMESEHPLIGPITTDRSPIRFMGEATPPCRPAPLLGEHNRYVYQTLLGLADGEYQAYLNQGVIR